MNRTSHKHAASRIGLILLGGLLVTTTTTTTTNADDWTQWRGADAAGISNETAWSVNGKSEALWSASIGMGYSSFVIRDGLVYTMGFSEAKGEDSVFCFNATTGEKIWEHSFPCKRHNLYHNGGTQCTPVLDGDHLYVLNREGNLYCYDAATGDIVWHKELNEEYELEYPTWMFSASPFVLGDQLIINVGRVLSLNKSNGMPKWTTRNTGFAYSTPMTMDVNGKRRLLIFNGDGLMLFDPSNGAELSSFEWTTKHDINAASPVVMDDRVFISSGYNHGCAMVEVTDDAMKGLWESKVIRTHMTGCIAWNGFLYGFDEATLKCIDTDGNVKWAERGLGKGTLMLADGKLIIISGKGELIIADASPGGFVEHSRQKVLEGGVYWAMPILANGLIYCRNSNGDMVCLDHRSSD
ncbi:MAG: PQQ-binding-like beta-propeller repeat protein [Planctomycetota bacterium]|nr:PQQ-binding-like beta-propeller repeat protein [Planctomycetota bacterium]